VLLKLEQEGEEKEGEEEEGEEVVVVVVEMTRR
jgi:hypothetical protein